jgi:integrase
MSRRGKHEGSIYQRKDHRWAAAVDLGFVDGARVRKTFYGPTREAVRKRLNIALGKHEQGGIISTNDTITVKKHLETWLANISVRPKTRRQYEQVVRLYLEPALGPVRLNKLEADQVRAMVRGLEARGLSMRTATLARDILRIALSQAVSDELIARNVAELVRRPKGRRREWTVLSPGEARALLDALSGHRLEALVTCGLALGLRLGEALGLQWADIDFTAARLTIRHALQTNKTKRELVDTKSRESHRTIAVPALVIRSLEQHKKAQAERQLAAGGAWQKSDFVFTTRVGRPLEGTLVTRDLRALVERLWVGGRDDCEHDRTRDRKCLDCPALRLPGLSYHALRHSCASLLLAAGIPVRDVSELLGHSDIRLTLSTYAHVLDGSRAKLAGVMNAVLDSQSDSQKDGRR